VLILLNVLKSGPAHIELELGWVEKKIKKKLGMTRLTGELTRQNPVKNPVATR